MFDELAFADGLTLTLELGFLIPEGVNPLGLTLFAANRPPERS